MNRHAWLQKHPSPLASRGEFHWYPDADAGDRELRAELVERLRGIEPPAVLWQLTSGRAAWGQAFSATAPDGRRYVGLVLSIVEADRPAGELLAMLAPPAAAPWQTGVPLHSPAADDVARFPRPMRGEAAGVARALLSGGAVNVDDPTSGELPRWIGSIERLLPTRSDRRAGVLLAGGARVGAPDRVAELVAAAWREPASRAAEAWQLLCELAAARGESIDQVGAALAGLDPGAVLTAAERAAVVGCDSVVGVLHQWGRGRLDGSPAAGTLAARLADLVALRVLGRLAAGADPGGAIAEARWYALLSAPRRSALLAAVAQRTQSLRALVEAPHA